MDLSVIIQLAILIVMIIIALEIRKLIEAVLKISPGNKKLEGEIGQIAFDIHRLTNTLGEFDQNKIKEHLDNGNKNNQFENRAMAEAASGEPLSAPIPPKGGPHYIQVVVIDQDFT